MKIKDLLFLFTFVSLYATRVNGQCVIMTCPSDTTVDVVTGCDVVVNYPELIALDTCLTTQLSFTACGATGQTGPTQSQISAAYSSTPLNGLVTSSNGIQLWTVPYSGTYHIEARGASGYGSFAGRGAVMGGDFILTANQVLKILVGQQGAPPVSPGTNQYGGGGGTFVTDNSNTPLLVAGGGGGSWAQSQNTNSDASLTTSGNPGVNGPTNGAGGTNGQGGASGSSADGGGGLLGDGGGTAGGKAFVNGGIGGMLYGHGGFGGGGGASGYNNRRCGGGGGYSGGGGAGSSTTVFMEAGGGGSFNAGTNQTSSAGVVVGDGGVDISIKGASIPATLVLGAGSGARFPLGTSVEIYEVTSSGNTVTCSFNVIVQDNSAPTVIAPFVVSTICETSGTVELPVGTPAGGTYSGTGISGNSFDPAISGPGTFWIVYTDTLNCDMSDSTSIVVEDCTGLDEYLGNIRLDIAPNPSNGVFSYESNGLEISEMEVYSAIGKIILRNPNPGQKGTLDLSDSPDGIYILKVRLNETLKTYQLIKR